MSIPRIPSLCKGAGTSSCPDGHHGAACRARSPVAPTDQRVRRTEVGLPPACHGDGATRLRALRSPARGLEAGSAPALGSPSRETDGCSRGSCFRWRDGDSYAVDLASHYFYLSPLLKHYPKGQAVS